MTSLARHLLSVTRRRSTAALGFVRAAETAGYRHQPMPSPFPCGYRLFLAHGVDWRPSLETGPAPSNEAMP